MSGSSSFFQDNLMVTGMSLGGLLIAVLGAIVHYSTEKEAPKAKSVIRDFIIGAVLVLLLLQLIPDSVTSVVESVMSGGGSLLASSTPEMDIQTGVPGF